MIWYGNAIGRLELDNGICLEAHDDTLGGEFWTAGILDYGWNGILFCIYDVLFLENERAHGRFFYFISLLLLFCVL